MHGAALVVMSRACIGYEVVEVRAEKTPQPASPHLGKKTVRPRNTRSYLIDVPFTKFALAQTYVAWRPQVGANAKQLWLYRRCSLSCSRPWMRLSLQRQVCVVAL